MAFLVFQVRPSCLLVLFSAGHFPSPHRLRSSPSTCGRIPCGYFLGVLTYRPYPVPNGFAAYSRVLRTFIPSNLLMSKVLLCRIFLKLLIKSFTHGKIPPVSVSIIRLFLKLAMFNLYR